MQATITMNKGGLNNVLGDRTKLRVRATIGGLQVRPTNRKLGSNLPEGEVLVEMARIGGVVPGAKGKLEMPGSALSGRSSTAYALVAGKHGWYDMNAVENVGGIDGLKIGIVEEGETLGDILRAAITGMNQDRAEEAADAVAIAAAGEEINQEIASRESAGLTELEELYTTGN